MKIAICFAGQPRSIERAYPYIRDNILDCNHSVDIFAHLWWDTNMIGKQLVAAGGAVASDALEADTILKFIDLYRPKYYRTDAPIEFAEREYNVRRGMFIRPKFSLSQRFSVSKAIQICNGWMRSTEIEYDLIVRMRTDWAITTKIDFDTIPLDQITMPDDGANGGYNDQFAVGNPTHMHYYSELYEEMDHLYYTHRVEFTDELLLKKHLQLRNIPVNLIPISYSLLRQSGAYAEVFGAEYI